MDFRIQIILRVIGEHRRTGQLSSREAGTLLGLSEAYFLRLFHQETGATFGRCSREVRMANAAELVKDNTLSIKGIARDSGYNDVSNFYRDFKQVHGMTPRQARLSHLARHSQGDRI